MKSSKRTAFDDCTSQTLETLDLLLHDAIEQLNLQVSLSQQHTLLAYLKNLLLWNKAYNLTAITDIKTALIKHIIDCLSILPQLHDGSLLDIGTGAGLPGLVIAICEPNRSVTVLDSNQKKIRFIRQMLAELKITNVTAIASRIEQYDEGRGEQKFAVVTSRAFASLTDFVTLALPFVADDGVLQAMKGVAPEAWELASLPQRGEQPWHITTTELTVPYLAEARHLVTLG